MAKASETIRFNGWRWYLFSKLDQSLLESATNYIGDADGFELVKTTRQKKILRLNKEQSKLIKHFSPVKWGNKLKLYFNLKKRSLSSELSCYVGCEALSPFVPKFYAYGERLALGLVREQMCIIEFLPNHVTLEYLLTSDQVRKNCVYGMLERIAHIIFALYEDKVIHPDLNSSNILLPVGDDGAIYVIDFESCSYLDEKLINIIFFHFAILYQEVFHLFISQSDFDKFVFSTVDSYFGKKVDADDDLYDFFCSYDARVGQKMKELMRYIRRLG